MEDVPAAMFTIVLIFIFIISTLMLYSNYLSQVGMIEQKRVASSVAEKIFFDSGGVISGLEGFDNSTGIRVKLINLETGSEAEQGSTGNNSVMGASMAITIFENGKYYPGRIEVYAG
jgi:hypothetical protein